MKLQKKNPKKDLKKSNILTYIRFYFSAKYNFMLIPPKKDKIDNQVIKYFLTAN